jgi:hypothetical protein
VQRASNPYNLKTPPTDLVQGNKPFKKLEHEKRSLESTLSQKQEELDRHQEALTTMSTEIDAQKTVVRCSLLSISQTCHLRHLTSSS